MLALFLGLGDLGPAGGRLTHLAAVAAEQGDIDAAREYWEGAREQFGAAGDRSGAAGAVHGLGDVALDTNDGAGALALYGEALETAAEMEEPQLAAYCLAGLAAALATCGRNERAALLWGAAERADAEVEVGIRPVDRARYERSLGEPDPLATAAGRELTVGEALELARAVGET
jgi:tetratricopeptide (TPR) repeat protein